MTTTLSSVKREKKKKPLHQKKFDARVWEGMDPKEKTHLEGARNFIR